MLDSFDDIAARIAAANRDYLAMCDGSLPLCPRTFAERSIFSDELAEIDALPATLLNDDHPYFERLYR